MTNAHDDRVDSLRITSRGYEVGANGNVPASQWLKWLEHIRWRTIAHSETLPIGRFWGLGVVRSQALEVLKQVSFDQELELTIWMSRLGRTSMDLSHDVFRVSDGERVARSTATLVSLDQNRLPRVIDDAARAYLVTRDTVPVDRLEGDPPEGSWTRPVDVRPSDHDMQQHVNHARYADFVEDTRLLCAEAGGYGSGHWDGPFRRITITYEQEARTGDGVVARTFRREDQPRTVDFVLTKGPGIVATRARVVLSG